MSKEKTKNNKAEEENNQEVNSQDLNNNETEVNLEETTEEDIVEAKEEEINETDVLHAEIAELKDKHLRLYSEFENYRRRTLKERQELIKTSTEDLMVELLPILDDFERAKTAGDDSSIKALQEGFDLIYQKFSRILKNKGLSPMQDKQGSKFDAEYHEAISQIPAPSKKLKGKLVDIVERGYKLNEKVIRFAKVVIGS